MRPLASTSHARQHSPLQVKAVATTDEAGRKEKKSRDGALTWEIAQPLEIPAVRILNACLHELGNLVVLPSQNLLCSSGFVARCSNQGAPDHTVCPSSFSKVAFDKSNNKYMRYSALMRWNA